MDSIDLAFTKSQTLQLGMQPTLTYYNSQFLHLLFQTHIKEDAINQYSFFQGKKNICTNTEGWTIGLISQENIKRLIMCIFKTKCYTNTSHGISYHLSTGLKSRMGAHSIGHETNILSGLFQIIRYCFEFV